MDDEDKFFLEVDAELQKMIDTDNASQLRGLRDRFAMAAMALMMPRRDEDFTFTEIAEGAYNLADAMMAERAK